MSSATSSDASIQPSHAASSQCTDDVKHGHKRARSPPYPPFVSDYRPYSNGQLQARRLNQHADLHKRQWDMYYRNNTVNGFKDRHYILREFHELRAAIDAAAALKACARGEAVPSRSTVAASPACSFSWMEAGCGVGNAMLPVFSQYGHLPQWRALLGFDISSVAIRLLEEKRALLPPELAAKVHVCVLNPVESEVADCTFFTQPGGDATVSLPSCADVSGASGADDGSTAAVRRTRACEPPEFVSLIFVLCSIPVSSHALVLHRISQCMARPGGVMYFRDYAVSDHAERRFQASPHRRCGDGGEESSTGTTSTYERTNGTLSHFFTLEEVRTLFEGVGFEVIALEIISSEVINRKTRVSFTRRFVQGRFRLRS